MTISAMFCEMKKLYALTLASRCHQCRHWRLKACNFPRRHGCSCKDRFFFKGGVELGPWSQDDGANDITTSSCLHSSHTLVKTNTRILQKEHQHKHGGEKAPPPPPPSSLHLPLLSFPFSCPSVYNLHWLSWLLFSFFKSQKEHEGQGVMDAYTVLRRRYHAGLDRGVFQETRFQTLLLQRTLDCCSAACFGFLRGHKITILVQSHQHGAWGLLSFTAEHVVVPQRVLWCTVRAHRFDTGLRGRHRTRPTVVWSSLDVRLWLFLLGRHLEESDGLVVFDLFFPFFNHCLIMCATELMGNDTFYTV